MIIFSGALSLKSLKELIMLSSSCHSVYPESCIVLDALVCIKTDTLETTEVILTYGTQFFFPE